MTDLDRLAAMAARMERRRELAAKFYLRAETNADRQAMTAEWNRAGEAKRALETAARLLKESDDSVALVEGAE